MADEKELAQVMIDLLKNDTLREKVIASGKSIVGANTWENIALAYDSLYSSFLKN